MHTQDDSFLSPHLALFGEHSPSSIRIPELRNIPLYGPLQAIVDHPAFQRLRQIKQLGPTHLVYPGAVHTRFEHSLGVYGCALWFVHGLLRHPSIELSLTQEDIQCVLAAALLHDIGHYPFAHSLEALHIKGQDTPKHEDVGALIIFGQIAPFDKSPTIAQTLQQQWKISPERVIALCTGDLGDAPSSTDKLLRSIISGAIDADKMDYLERDSHHMGVPYGRHYDRQRLLASLTLNQAQDGIAIEAKGKVPAEMFIFSRYTMFSEAYWHHTVRSASAMVEHALAHLHPHLNQDTLLQELLSHDDDQLMRWLYAQAPQGSPAQALLQGIIPHQRQLYKRVMTLSRAYLEAEKQRAYEIIYTLNSQGIATLTARLHERVGAHLQLQLPQASLIIDTPPRDKDKLETVELLYPHAQGQRYYPLHQLSRIVAGIQDDFTTIVKKIRIFAAPSLAQRIAPDQPKLQEIILDEILATARI